MTNSFNSDSFTTTSFTAETIVIPEAVGSSGGLARFRRPTILEKLFVKDVQFSKNILSIPFTLQTFTKDIGLIPKLPKPQLIETELEFKISEPLRVLTGSKDTVLTNFSQQLKSKSLSVIDIVRIGIKLENKLSFDFNEASFKWKGSKIYTDAAKFLQFDQSSSFVGNVVYEKDKEEMLIVLGDRIYNFCNVPREIYDGFQRASSKGKYFNSFIKELWNC